MIPVAPLVWFAIWAMRRRGGPASAPPPDGPATRLLQRSIPTWFWVHLLYPFLLAPVLILVRGAVSMALVLAALTVLYFPWSWARLVARAGWIRGARLFGWLALFTCRKDRKGGPWLAAALALCARRRHDEKAAQRIAEGAARVPAPVRGATLAALGLVAASRGHREEARDLLRSIALLDPRITPAAARRVARDWLAADAAARGDWPEVMRLGEAPGPRSRALRFLSLAARRLAGTGKVPSDRWLRMAWILAPRRRATRPLLSLALAAPRQRSDAGSLRAPREGTALCRAAALHAAAMAAPPGSLDAPALRAVGAAWDAALEDPETARALLARELALGADGKSEALRRLNERVRAEVAWLVGESAVPLRRLRGSELLEAAALQVRDALIADLEAESAEMQRRAAEQSLLPLAEEWRALARLRHRYVAASARLDQEGRRMAFEILHPALSAVAVELYNVSKQRSVANAVFGFLAAEAEAVSDAASHELHRKNQLLGW